MALIGEAGNARPTYRRSRQIHSINKKFLRIFLYSLRFANLQSTNCMTNSIGAEEGKRKNRQRAENYLQRFAYFYRNRLIILLY
jgi:hypothetical protein